MRPPGPGSARASPAIAPPTPLPGTIGSASAGIGNGARPARSCVSTKVTFANSTAITTCPDPGTGSSAGAGTSTPGGPNSLSTITCMAAAFQSERFTPIRVRRSESLRKGYTGRVTGTRGRQQEAARNDRRVLDAAREVFATQGWDAPVSAVAERAGVGMGSLYRRYGSKTELLQRLCVVAMEQNIGAPRAGPR